MTSPPPTPPPPGNKGGAPEEAQMTSGDGSSAPSTPAILVSNVDRPEPERSRSRSRPRFMVDSSPPRSRSASRHSRSRSPLRYSIDEQVPVSAPTDQPPDTSPPPSVPLSQATPFPVADTFFAPRPPTPTTEISPTQEGLPETPSAPADTAAAPVDYTAPVGKPKPSKPARKQFNYEPDPMDSDREHKDDDIVELKPIRNKAARGRRMRSPSTATMGSLNQTQDETPSADALIKPRAHVDNYAKKTSEEGSEGSDDTKVGGLKAKINGLKRSETFSKGSNDSNAKASEGVPSDDLREKAARRRVPIAHGAERHIAFDIQSNEGDDDDEDGDSAGKMKRRKGGKWTQSSMRKFFDKVWHIVWVFLGKPEFGWIKPRLNWNDLEPVFRVGISTWLGFLLILILPSGRAIGMAGFLVLIVACMVPPWPPLVQYLEIVLNLFFYVSVGWAWVALGTCVANAVRVPTDPARIAAGLAAAGGDQMKSIFNGTYIQARPSIVCAVWLSVGTGIALWWKLRTAPSPATFPLVLTCIMIDVSMTVVHMYPGAFYKMGWLVFKPIAIQAGIGVVCSIFVFPQSVTHQFRRKFAGVLSPLAKGIGELEEHFTQAASLVDGGDGPPDKPSREPFPPDDDRTSFDSDRSSDEEHKIHAWGDWSASIRTTLLGSLAGMQPLQAQERYLDVDISYTRLSGHDLKELFYLLTSIQIRASGLSFFFNQIVNKIRRTHLDSGAFNAQSTLGLSRPESQLFSRPLSRATSHVPSRPPSRGMSRPPSSKDIRRDSSSRDMGELRSSSARDVRDVRNSSYRDVKEPQDATVRELKDQHHADSTPGSPRSGVATPHRTSIDEMRDHAKTLAHKLHLFRHSDKNLHSSRPSTSDLTSLRGSTTALQALRDLTTKGSHLSLLDRLRKAQQPVGVYESQRYMDMELADDSDLQPLVRQLELLAAGALPLVKCLKKCLQGAVSWSQAKDKKRWTEDKYLSKSLATLKVILAEFKEHRVRVIDPYRDMFDPLNPTWQRLTPIQHKGLYYCFVAQYHLIEFSEAVIAFVEKALELDAIRPKKKLWLPRLLALFAQFRESVKSDVDHAAGDNGEDDDQELEDEEREMYSKEHHELGEARRRDPDYSPYTNILLVILGKVIKIPDLIFSKSGMYAVKAGVLGCLTSLPAFFSSSAAFYYANRGIWCTIMAQLTLAVYAGDTFSAWFGRLQASFWGCCFGIVVWYIGSGHGKGNPYGLAVICFFVFMALNGFYRNYNPGPMLTRVMTNASLMLVVGYSYMNANIIQTTNATWGWDVGWRRFVCVIIGITCAWVFSYFPPTYSARHAIRYSYAGTINKAGRILCTILSAANDPHEQIDPAWNPAIRKELVKTRTKLSSLGIRHNNARKEFSIRGAWPEERYRGLMNTLIETMGLLSQLNHLLPQMDWKWRKAFLMRTRMNDPLFLGDVLAIISMSSTALRVGSPLPQITPGPLVAKYHLNKYKGLDAPLIDPAKLVCDEDDIPSVVTIEVLESEEYMRYALGVSTAYALMTRLDAIIVACKSLLGENYHIANMKLDHLMV